MGRIDRRVGVIGFYTSTDVHFRNRLKLYMILTQPLSVPALSFVRYPPPPPPPPPSFLFRIFLFLLYNIFSSTGIGIEPFSETVFNAC